MQDRQQRPIAGITALGALHGEGDVEGARATWAAVGELVDLDDVSKVLEVEGVAAFEKSFDELLGVLTTRAGDLA